MREPAPAHHATTVLVAFGNPLTRRTLCDGLSHRGPCDILEAGSPDETERIASDHGPGDLALVDMAFEERHDQGADLVQVLRREGWDHVVAIGDPSRLDRIGATLRAGARGYLFTAAPRVPAAVEAIPDQRQPVDPITRRVRVLDAGGQERELSHREVEVLRLAAEGLGNSEIGHVLGLSALTVKSHLARITSRLHARDRAHMVLLALRAGAIR
ncbi:response regulator transcription factor [Pseudonocardia sp.]|jgi:DNA-binding NarL/FixJ family response regulator|uniref:response regulator transcription factor n=1 Tax=Pseudonocardia sp. TaxID=60912 RepID=UPI0026194980|nr:response regulator transcription factor [Pseudonocardia sp.]MCW2719120.1 DNA-binding response regulator [Pseudonocardia sp.]MDT7613464.1 hypothetical protein [Pseudonocardiales bacterium]